MSDPIIALRPPGQSPGFPVVAVRTRARRTEGVGDPAQPLGDRDALGTTGGGIRRAPVGDVGRMPAAGVVRPARIGEVDSCFPT
jgi:hypothetical protein